MVDPDKYEQLNKYKWHALTGSRTAGIWYAARAAVINGRQHTIRMHQVLLPPPEGFVVDHINGDGLDNRLANLRLVTPIQNCWNRRFRNKNCASKYTGVTWEKRAKKWRAGIYQNGKKIFLGLFSDEVQAAKAYDAAALKYRGEFAVLNFPLKN